MTDNLSVKRGELIGLIRAKAAFPMSPRIEAKIAELGHAELDAELEEWRARRSERGAFERPAAAAGVLKRLLDRSNFQPRDLDPDDDPLDAFADHLEQENGIRVRDDGRVEFRHLTADNRDLIDDLPVVVCHYTSSELVESIRRAGLVPGFVRTNPHMNSYAGVYVTTDWAGPVVDGYCRVACGAHGGRPVRIEIEAFLHELFPDNDDADIASGRVQFVMGAVRPSRIIEVSGC